MQSIIKKETFKKTPNLIDYEKTYKDFSWEKAAKEFVSFFDDGTINIAYSCVDRHAIGKKKNKTALIFEAASGQTETYTFADLQKLTNQFANVLVDLGIEKGDRVFVFLPPVPERYIAFLGTVKIGAICGTLFSAFQEEALLDRLSDSKAKVIVTNTDLLPRIEKVWKKLPGLENIILVNRNAAEAKTSEPIISYEKAIADASDTFDPLHMQKTDYSYMLYTSGTTGKPKGVVHAHFDVLQAMVTTNYVLDLHEDDVYWCTADMGWVTGVVYGVLGIWGLGGTSVVYEGRFSPENWYNVLQKHKVTIWYTAPTVIRMLMAAAIDIKQFNLRHLRHLASVGEPLNPEAIWWALKVFELPFHDTWWQTELGSICITNFPSMNIKPGSMGKPLPGIVAAIVDDNGNELEANTEGNLALQPETVSALMKTVWGNKEKFDSYFSHGWYLSGDKAYRDEEGYFWFIGRADDVIKTMGERIGPFEVESSLVEYPDVVEAGVIGKPDKLRGEIIKAFVVLKPGVKPTEDLKEKLKQHVKRHLAGHAYPREVEFIDKLPKTRSGKIMRRVLKAKELGLPVGDTSTLEDY
ncbi:MAG TPA: acetate--CoA ligase [Patescibacteria group bacterium]|nr:acetate--CoA ligase [Patescibacteria group bacterium]